MDTPTATPKPGWKTSEFWLHLLSYVPAILATVVGPEHPAVLALGAVVTLSGQSAAKSYTSKRVQVKGGAPATDPVLDAVGRAAEAIRLFKGASAAVDVPQPSETEPALVARIQSETGLSQDAARRTVDIIRGARSLNA